MSAWLKIAPQPASVASNQQLDTRESLDTLPGRDIRLEHGEGSRYRQKLQQGQHGASNVTTHRLKIEATD